MEDNTKLQAVTDQSAGTKVKNGILGIILNILLWVFSLVCIFPLVWMLYSSLKEKREFNASMIALPSDPTLVNYFWALWETVYVRPCFPLS